MQRSDADMGENARTRVKQISADQVMNEPADNMVLLDCREANEWHMARIPGAVFIPLGEIEAKVEQLVPCDMKVVVYCAAGARSALAADIMSQMGYSDVASMAGGISAWADAGGPIE